MSGRMASCAWFVNRRCHCIQQDSIGGGLLQEQVSGLARQRYEVESLPCGREGSSLNFCRLVTTPDEDLVLARKRQKELER